MNLKFKEIGSPELFSNNNSVSIAHYIKPALMPDESILKSALLNLQE
jgi:hypothetical protein